MKLRATFYREILTKNRHYGVSVFQNFNGLTVTVKASPQYYYFMKDCDPYILFNLEKNEVL